MRVKIIASVCACFLFLAMARVGTAQEAELPTWNIGDTWAIGGSFPLSYSFTEMGLTYEMSGSGSYNVTYTVLGAGQEYTVDLTGGLEMAVDMNVSGSYLGEQVSGSIHMTAVAGVDGTAYYTRDELALTRVNEAIDLDADFSGSVTAAGQTQSFSGSMDVTGNADIAYDPALDIFDFPIMVGESWTANSVATVTGSMSEAMNIYGTEQSIDIPLDATVSVSLSLSCLDTVDLPPTCYKIEVLGTGIEQANPFIPASVLYYSPDRGFIVAAELPFGKALGGTTLGSEEDIPFAGGITGGEEMITLSQSVAEAQSREKIDIITPGVPGVITVENTNVENIEINVGAEVENVVLTIQQFAEKPFQAEVAAPGTAYKYLDFVAENITPEDIENVGIKFKVERSWVSEQGIDVDTITLQRYNPVSEEWVPLPTEQVEGDAEYIYFSAASESLSLFCVVGEELSPEPLQAGGIDILLIGAIVAVAVVIAAAVFVARRRR